MLLEIAPENEDQVGGAARGALVYWIAIHSEGQEVGFVLVHPAQDWVECEAEGGLAKARQPATRNVGGVLQSVMEVVAMVRQRDLCKHPGARQESRHLTAAKICLNTNEAQAKGNAYPSIHFDLLPTLLYRSLLGRNPRKIVIHSQSRYKSLICI